MAEPTPERRRELLRELTRVAVEAGTYGEPAPEMRPAPERTPQDDTTPDLRNVDWSQAVVCYSRCWSCQFDYHQKPPKAHTWMDEDDAEHAGHPWPLPPEVAATHLCACRCAKPKEARRA